MDKPLVAFHELRNLGLVSEKMLIAAGIDTVDGLRQLGSVAAYLQVRQSGQNPGLNLLYALEAALMDVHWLDLPYERKSELLLEMDAMEDMIRHR